MNRARIARYTLTFASLALAGGLIGAGCTSAGDDAEATACKRPNPVGCLTAGCPDGQECVADQGCAPSSCGCHAETGDWICSSDCGGGVCVARNGDAGEGATCKGPNPAGCVQTGCPDGQECVTDDADACTPSSCGCDPATDTWICTTDCNGGVCVARGDAGSDAGGEAACEGPNPAGCVSTGCPSGQTCVDDGSACVPSGCGCDASSGTWTCTADCNGGVCVDETAR